MVYSGVVCSVACIVPHCISMWAKELHLCRAIYDNYTGATGSLKVNEKLL